MVRTCWRELVRRRRELKGRMKREKKINEVGERKEDNKYVLGKERTREMKSSHGERKGGEG